MHPYVYAQGRRKVLKVGGGAGFEGHFSNKKGHIKFFSRRCWRRGGEGGGGHLKNFFRTYKKNFPHIARFFPKSEKNFPDIPKNFFGYMIFFPEMNKIFR